MPEYVNSYDFLGRNSVISGAYLYAFLYIKSKILNFSSQEFDE